jgi:hypothetical protein
MSPMPHNRNARRITIIGPASVISLLTNGSAEETRLNISRNGVCLSTDKRFHWGRRLH